MNNFSRLHIHYNKQVFSFLVLLMMYHIFFYSIILSSELDNSDENAEIFDHFYSIKIYSNIKDWERALNDFSALLKYENTEQNDNLKSRAAKSLIRDLCMSSRFENALDVYAQVSVLDTQQSETININNSDSANYIIGYYLSMKDFNSARRYLKSYPDVSKSRDASFLKLRIMKLMVNTFTDGGNIEAAIEIADDMSAINELHETKLLAAMAYYKIFFETRDEGSIEMLRNIFNKLYALGHAINYNKMITYVGNFLKYRYNVVNDKTSEKQIESMLLRIKSTESSAE